MDEMADEQSWLRGGGSGVWQSKELHHPSHSTHQSHQLQEEADPFAEFGDWGTGGAEAAPMMSLSSSWQSSMHEHDSTFPSAYPLFSDSVNSLSSPSNLLSSTSTFSFTASASHNSSSSFHSNHTVNNSAAKTASDGQWPSRNTTPALSDLTSPRLSLASTNVSSSASSALSSTPSSVSSSSPVSPLILSQRDAARRPEAIRVPPFDAAPSNMRPTFIPPASLPTSLPGAPHVFSSSASAAQPSNAADSSKYQTRDMTSGTPIFSSSSMSPPTIQPRQLLPRPPPQPHSHSQPHQPQSQHTPPPLPPATVASPLPPPPEHAPSPTIAFRSMSIATGSPLLNSDSLSPFHPPHSLQPTSGKEKKQTSIRATRKSVENAPMTGVQRLIHGSHSPTMATASASVMAVPALPTAGHTPPSAKRKSSRKLGVMIDVPVKPSMSAAAAMSNVLAASTPPKLKRSASKVAVFSPQSFTSSPRSPDRPFAAPVVATISPLTEQRTMRATGVTVASPVEANSRLAPYLANGPTSPPVAAPIGPYSNYFSPQPQQQGASTTAARAISPYDDDNRSTASHLRHQPQHQQQQQHSIHAKQREEHKSNDDAQVMCAPSRFTPGDPSRFSPPDDHSLPSTPYSPGLSAHDAHSRYPAASPPRTPQSSWTRQYSAPAAAPSFNQSPNDTVRQHGRPERGSFAAPHQPSMARSVSSSHSDSSVAASWAETQYLSRTRHSQPATPLDNSPYPDSSPTSLPTHRPSYMDETASSALLSTLAAKFSAMQRATSAPAQPPHNFGGRQRSESDGRNTPMDGQRTPPGHPSFDNNTSALLGQRQQVLLDHFRQSNPTLQALSPEATAFLAALMGAEQTHNGSQSMQAATGMHQPPSNDNSSRPPSSPAIAYPSSSHQQPSHSPVSAFTDKQLHQLQQHLNLQQRHLQQKLAQQFQHQGSRPANGFQSTGQQQYDARPLPSSHQSARPMPTGPLTPCPMSSSGCEMQFRSANEMQAHFLSCHM